MRSAHKTVFSLAALAAAFLAGYWLRPPGPASSKSAVRQPLYYYCPMHPGYRSDKPGVAPCCGMQLEPAYAEGAATGPRTGDGTPGAVRISLEKQQLIGLQTAQVTRTSGSHTFRVLGRVAADETRVHRITALADGVVRLVSPYAVGNIVHKDELLARYFVSLQEVYSAIQAYFVAMTTLEQGVALNWEAGLIDSAKAQIRLSEELLQAYGLTEMQLREIARTRQATRDIEFRSPVTGLVLSRNVAVGQRVERGAELFRVADLSHVWVLADLFENESGLIRPGSAARVRYQRRIYQALLSDARQFDPVSRTLKVRLDLDNPGFVLRPDMFVDVEFDLREPEGISVAVDAVLDSGRRRVVFISRGDGAFEPREVATGARYGDRVQILEGLQEGETVVVSGLFLLDSESRLQSAATASAAKPNTVAAASTDPVCGMEVEPSKAAYQSQHQGTTYFFCSKDCKAKFDSDPSRFVKKQPDPMKPGAS